MGLYDFVEIQPEALNPVWEISIHLMEYRAHNTGSRTWSSHFSALDVALSVEDLGFRVWGCRVQGWEFGGRMT